MEGAGEPGAKEGTRWRGTGQEPRAASRVSGREEVAMPSPWPTSEESSLAKAAEVPTRFCVFAHMWVFMHVCTCMWRPKVDVGDHLQLSTLLSQGLSIKPRAF